MKTLADVADFYETHDWIQGSYISDDGNGYCVSGAMMKIVGLLDDIPSESEEYLSAQENFMALSRQFRQKLLPDIYVSLPHWNDRVARSKEEVIAFLRS